MRIGVVFHIPHASRHVPASVRSSLLLSDSELEAELLRMTDAYTDELFHRDSCDVAVVRHQVSRLVVDPERFEDDAQEGMSRIGMGVIYTKTSGGRELRAAPTHAEREALLDAYYRPHHRKLEEAVGNALRDNGSCLIVDCHSFSSRPLPYESDQEPNRPDFCIGTDAFHTPNALANSLLSEFARAGYKTALNRPYAGALVPSVFYKRETRVSSVMIEVNRALYMDENTGAKVVEFENVRDELAQSLSGAFAAFCL